MTLTLSLSDIAAAFPNFRAAVVVADNLAITPERPAALNDLIAQRETEARVRWSGVELSQIPGIAAWRSAYKAFGVKQTRYRSSVERLVKNVLAGRELARVNTFVDLYNAVSLEHVLPLGADDLDHVTAPLAFRYALPHDNFLDMSGGEEEGGVEAPKPGEVVYADAAKVLCRRWNWRQDARSLVGIETRRAVATVQSNGAGDVAAAAADLVELIGRFCGGVCRVEIAEASRPTVSF
jgi:DNA/RNA-binding domain of Phe-tRNA-synthetase-like protein